MVGAVHAQTYAWAGVLSFFLPFPRSFDRPLKAWVVGSFNNSRADSS
jgi:hypothetical protein